MTTKRIIVIDDEFQITRVLKRSLGAHRYDVRTASDGGAGIDLFHDFDPDSYQHAVHRFVEGEPAATDPRLPSVLESSLRAS